MRRGEGMGPRAAPHNESPPCQKTRRPQKTADRNYDTSVTAHIVSGGDNLVRDNKIPPIIIMTSLLQNKIRKEK